MFVTGKPRTMLRELWKQLFQEIKVKADCYFQEMVWFIVKVTYGLRPMLSYMFSTHLFERRNSLSTDYACLSTRAIH